MRLPTTTSRRVGNTSKNSDYGNETQRTGDEDHDDDDRYSNEAIGGSTTASSSSRPTSLVGRHRRRRTFADVVNKRLIFMGIVILITSWIAGFLATYIWVSYYESDKSMPTGESFGSVAKNINNRDANYDSPLLIFTCRREKYLKETLETLLKYIPHGCQFGCPVIVSEDGKHDPIEAVINGLRPRFDEIGVPLVHMVHTKNLRRDVSKGASAYVALAQHYKWALTTIFERKFGRIDDPEFPNPHRVIILEEDIRVAPDFFEYMKATAPILDNDSTLFAVSAFNDNGHQGVSDPTRLLRSDFFPGLGWMLTSSLWEEVKVKWPDGYWDDWLRDPLQRKGRQVIRPEISRTYHFGKKGGASSNQFGSILERVKLNTEAVDWSSQDLSYLSPAIYDQTYMDMVRHSRRAPSIEEGLEIISSGTSNVVVPYAGFADFQDMARQLGLMDDEKAGVPRTAYKGVVESRKNDHFLFLAPIDVI